MIVELVLRGSDDDVLKLNFLKDLPNLETALCFQTGKFVSDRRSKIVGVLSQPSSVVAHKAPF